MKNSNFFLLAVTAATVVSCGTHPSSYTINGTVSDTTLNGNKVAEFNLQMQQNSD